MQGSGMLSMTIALFLFTSYHDMVINIAGCIAMIAITGTYIGLYRWGLYAFFWFGIFNGMLIAINNFLYYTPGMLTWLPLFQKVTFVSFITWICFITIHLYKGKKKESPLSETMAPKQ